MNIMYGFSLSFTEIVTSFGKMYLFDYYDTSIKLPNLSPPFPPPAFRNLGLFFFRDLLCILLSPFRV